MLDFSGLCSKREIAGAYGRVIAKGPHFEFEKLPGVKQRFYGVNQWDSDWHLNALIAIQCH